MKKLLLKLLLIGGVVLTACKKEDINNIENNNVKLRSDIATFDSFNDLLDQVQKTRQMSLEELKTYEESKGYLSFGRHSDELYFSIDFESLKTEDEYIEIVAKNSQYLELLTKDGDKYFETKLANNPYRYIMNKDNLFIVGKRVYKVFDSGLVSTYLADKAKLINYNPKDLKSEKSNEIFQLSFSQMTFVTKDAGSNCGPSLSGSQTNGNERTNIGASLSFFDGEDGGIGRFTQLMNDAFVRPYKKTLGIWYYCNRTISFNFKLAVDRYDGTWLRKFDNSYNAGQNRSVLWFSTAETICFGGFCSQPVHYGGSLSYGDTPSTDNVNMNCNTYLF